MIHFISEGHPLCSLAKREEILAEFSPHERHTSCLPLESGGRCVNPELETEFDPAICWQAISTRDRRFDGRFFAGVITTKVYCRPICPIPLRKPENVKWFASAASAQAQGFRPCRRCRPHTSPGTAAWHGTLAVVSRALRLIEAGALDHGNVDELAEHVGMGARHLRRLFAQHLGAAPIQIASARRLRLARQLLKDAALSVNKVAFSAGFQSIRQFNHAIRSSFEQSPSELRRGQSPVDPLKPGDEILLRLPFRPPLDWPVMLRFFREHRTPGIESVDDHCYRRTIQVGDSIGFIEVTSDPTEPRLLLRVRPGGFDSLIHIAQRVRTLFDLDADPRQISDHLARDRRLRSTIAAYPGLRLPGAWDAFELAVLAILGQRLGRRASATAVRLVRAFGRPIETSIPGLTHLFPPPDTLAKADFASIGIKTPMADRIRALAAGFRDGKVPPSTLRGTSLLQARTFTQPRLGEKISQYLAMRTLGEPDIFPVSDSGVKRAAARWRPWGAYAAMYLWIADEQRPIKLRATPSE
jgi:AraC family transcriptional regulator, regulatory protein of adaptative response / DNA-3-methyladenine glycosylase II